MNVLSLFDGMSCGQIALKKLGVRVDNYFASEIDKYAIKVTQHNFPNTIQLGDVRNVKASDLPKIDLILAGSPCQGFSFAGKQLAFNNPRSALFFEFVRILKECNPRYFLLENVKMKKEYELVISKYVNIAPIEINSALVSSQNRVRNYWTNIASEPYGLFGDMQCTIPQPKDKGILLRDILETDVPEKYYLKNKKLVWWERMKEYQLIKKYNQLNGKKALCLMARTYAAWNGDFIEDEKGIRTLTPIEAERIQTVPDNYTNCISDSHRYKLLGNGWTIDVICHILSFAKSY